MNRFVLFTNVISPHQLPLAKELAAQVGEENFRYIYTERADKDHGGLGWSFDVPDWCVHASDTDSDEWLENADVLLSGLRCFDLFERRAAKGLTNFYMTERWFKPPVGIFRLLHPRYFGYARRLCRLLESGAVTGLPIGIHAARDMARLCGFVHGKISSLFKAPELDFERKPGGSIWLAQRRRGAEKYCLDKMRMWGYFVKSSEIAHNSQFATRNSLKILWVGRLLDWKRVDTIIRAVGELAVSSRNRRLSVACDSSEPSRAQASAERLAVSDASTRFYTFCTVNHLHVSTRSTRLNISLDIYGSGPEEARLKKLAAKYGDIIKFHPPVPIGDVRKLMRAHDVYVLSSNGYEGWGAVVSEALEEGMKVLGTYESGACATMLPDTNLFHAGDWKRLAKLLTNEISPVAIGDWTAQSASNYIISEEKKIQQHV